MLTALQEKRKDRNTEIALAFHQGKGVQEIADAHHLKYHAVYHILRKAGITVNKVKEQQLRNDAIEEQYRNGIEATKIAKAFGVSYMRVFQILEIRGIPKRGMHREYNLNEKFFSCGITTPEHAWLLGFISTDGNVTKDKGALNISLQKRDQEILDRIKELLDYDGPIRHFEPRVSRGPRGRTIKGGPQCRLTINSAKLVKDLVRLGIEPNKTFTIKPPEIKDPGLRAAYWLGCFDGDGGWSHYDTSEKTKRQWRMCFCGNFAMVSGFARFVEEITGCEAHVEQRDSIFRVGVSHLAKIQKLIEAMWGKSRICLERKKKIADFLREKEVAKKKSWSHLTSENFEQLLEEHGSWSGVSRFLGIDRTDLLKYRHRLGLQVKLPNRWAYLTKEMLLKLHQEHGSWSQVARTLGMHRGVLTWILKDRNVPKGLKWRFIL